jgi:hypothetical protein
VRTSLDIQDTFFMQHLLNCLENFFNLPAKYLEELYFL